ncbi:hypothetical protein [Halorussus amylolyticus]|uniref:hypothetical protein n=1 Tax=Halorussus amylolyticus TaxID=1126242 RepID=UPI00104BD999|nr:hypothetical protein [Halorussus amylolyticus]
MVSWTVFVPPVLSALLGAVAIRGVEIVSARRKAVSAIQHELRENYHRIEGEIRDVENERWQKQYTREIRLDAIDAIKAGNPTVYAQIVEEVDKFPTAMASLENLRREAIASRQPDAFVPDNDDELIKRLSEVQEIVVEADRNLVDFATKGLLRRFLYSGAVEGIDQFKISVRWPEAEA